MKISEAKLQIVKEAMDSVTEWALNTMTRLKMKSSTLLIWLKSCDQSGLSVSNRTVPYIPPLDSVRFALYSIEREPYIPLVWYSTIYFASGIWEIRFGLMNVWFSSRMYDKNHTSKT